MPQQQHVAIWRTRRVSLSRRQILAGAGSVLVLRPAAALAQVPSQCRLTIDSGEGPFYFDPMLMRSAIADGHAGAPLALEIEVVSVDGCAVLENARVDVWHANGVGLYSGYSNQPGVGGGLETDVRGEAFLRGTQFTDAQGHVEFATIYPSWYGGRTPHIHFKVFISEREVIAGQIFFPDAINNEVFSQWEPYRHHVERRTTFNDNDMFRTDGVLQGAVAEAQRSADGYRARATLAVAV